MSKSIIIIIFIVIVAIHCRRSRGSSEIGLLDEFVKKVSSTNELGARLAFFVFVKWIEFERLPTLQQVLENLALLRERSNVQQAVALAVLDRAVGAELEQLAHGRQVARSNSAHKRRALQLVARVDGRVRSLDQHLNQLDAALARCQVQCRSTAAGAKQNRSERRLTGG